MNTTAPIENFFVCVGAQKAGTTWLARVLGDQPDLFLTPVKEIHYFDHIAGLGTHLARDRRRSRLRKYYQRHLTQWHRWQAMRAQAPWYRTYMGAEPGDDWYRALFAARGGARFAGELTPDYALIGVDGFAHLKQLSPRVRVLYILRAPLARAWSHVLHEARRMGIDAARTDPGNLIALTETDRFRALSDYAATIDDLRAVFDAGQLMFAFYEDIHGDRMAALARIADFIGFAFDPAHVPDLARRFNVSQSAEMPGALAVHLAARNRGVAQDVETRLGRVPDAWRTRPPGLPNVTNV